MIRYIRGKGNLNSYRQMLCIQSANTCCVSLMSQVLQTDEHNRCHLSMVFTFNTFFADVPRLWMLSLSFLCSMQVAGFVGLQLL